MRNICDVDDIYSGTKTANISYFYRGYAIFNRMQRTIHKRAGGCRHARALC